MRHASVQILFKWPTFLNVQKCSVPLSFFFFFFTLLTSKCASPQRRALFRHVNFPKVLRDRQFLTLLTLKCASRHNCVHFFNISTSKSGPHMVCFVHFDLEMCFAPQWRALFNISTSKSDPNVGLFFFCVFTCKCASRHNGVQFFISRLARLLHTRRFSQPTFRPS